MIKKVRPLAALGPFVFERPNIVPCAEKNYREVSLYVKPSVLNFGWAVRSHINRVKDIVNV